MSICKNAKKLIVIKSFEAFIMMRPLKLFEEVGLLIIA
jgi:hypothetical protein